MGYMISLRSIFRKPFQPSLRVRAGALATAVAVIGVLVTAGSALWPSETLAAETSWAATPPVRIVIHKGNQVLELYNGGTKVKTYRVCLGLDPLGAKRTTGDCKTPEGDYFICSKSASSSFHRFLGISYPGEHDATSAFEEGLISLDTRNAIIRNVREGRPPPWNTKLGGWVGIHGYPTDPSKKLWVSLLYPKPHNWTNGCIAMWDFEIEELFAGIEIGTPVSILP